MENDLNTSNEKLEAIANATLESGQQMMFLAQENEELRQQVSQMQDILEKMQSNLDDKDNSSQSTNNRKGKGRKQRSRNPRGFDASSKHYCWSHGLTRTPFHTSKTCRDPEPGHKKEATFNNRMSGTSYKCHLANATTQNDDNSGDD